MPSGKIPRLPWAQLWFLCIIFLKRDVYLPWVFVVSNPGLMFPCFKGRSLPIGKSSVAVRQGRAAHQAAPTQQAQTPRRRAKEGSPRTEPQPHPHRVSHNVTAWGVPMATTLFSQAEHTDATHQAAHSKLLFSQGFSNLRRCFFRSCLKCYEINSFWGTVMTPVPQKAGVGQREKGRGTEVLAGKGHLAPLPSELLHSPGNTGTQ